MKNRNENYIWMITNYLSKYIKLKKFTKIKDGLYETIKWFKKFKNRNLLIKIIIIVVEKIIIFYPSFERVVLK